MGSRAGEIRQGLVQTYGSLLAAFELSGDGYAFTLDTAVVWANGAAAAMLEIPREDMTNGALAEALGDRFDVHSAIRQIARVGESADAAERYCFELSRRDGSTLTVDVSSLPFAFDGATLVLWSVRDVSVEARTQRALSRSERSLQESQRIAHIGSWELDLRAGELHWSPEIYRMFELDPVGFEPSYEAFLEVIHPDDRAVVDEAYRRSLATQTPYAIVHRLRMADGRIKHVHERCETFYSETGVPLRSIGTVLEVTAQVETEQRLQRERNFNAAVLEHMGGLVVVLDKDGCVREFNRAAEELSGFRLEEVRGRRPQDTFLPPEIAEHVMADVFQRMVHARSPVTQHYVNEWITKDGGRRLLEWSNVVLFDDQGEVEFLVALGIDITARNAADSRLKAELAEKEVLLREIHHRVKNNMQIISSMLALQADRADDPYVFNTLQESRGRVRAMAIVHETLYQSGQFAHVVFSDYARRLAAAARAAFMRPDGPVEIEIDVNAAPLELEVAIPCGLIAHELLANAFEHGFPDGRPGRVWLSFREEATDRVLTVRDDGIGFPAAENPTRRSLGVELVRALTAQLSGKLNIETHQGTTVRVTFPRDDR